MRSNPPLCFHIDALPAGPHPDFSLGFYRGGLGGKIFLRGGFCIRLNVDAEDPCNKNLSFKVTPRICKMK